MSKRLWTLRGNLNIYSLNSYCLNSYLENEHVKIHTRKNLRTR